MDNALLVSLAGGLVIALLIALGLWQRGKPQTVEDVATLFREAATDAPTVVAAVEQLWQTGKLPKDKRLDTAIQWLGGLYSGLDDNQLRIAIEAAVQLAKVSVAVVKAQ